MQDGLIKRFFGNANIALSRFNKLFCFKRNLILDLALSRLFSYPFWGFPRGLVSYNYKKKQSLIIFFVWSFRFYKIKYLLLNDFRYRFLILSNSRRNFNTEMKRTQIQIFLLSTCSSYCTAIAIPLKEEASLIWKFLPLSFATLTLLFFNVLNQKSWYRFFYLQRAYIFNLRPKCLQIPMLLTVLNILARKESC